MAGAYQPTTIQKEESEAVERSGFCNPFHGRRQHRFELDHRQPKDDEGKEIQVDKRNERVNQWLFSRCVSKQDGQMENSSAVPTPTGSERNFPTSTTDTVVPSKLNRAQTLKKKIVKSTENFFGLGDCEEQHANLQRKWTQRKKRHYSRRYGALVETAEDTVDASSQAERPSAVGGSISSFQSSHHPPDPALVRTLSRRQSVANMAWKRMRKMKDGAAAFKSTSKPQPISTLLEAGRSFSPAVMTQAAEDEIDSAFHTESAIEFHDFEDDVFFNFTAERPRRKKTEKAGFLPGIHEEEERPPAPGALDEVEGPPGTRPPLRSTRGQRIADRPHVTNANRRVYGKGLVGRWLNRTIKRKRLTSSVRKQIESLADHRPYFTYWVSFVQVVVLIVGVSVYKIAPIGFTDTYTKALVETSQKGTLVPTFLERSDPDNFWIGPDQASLIRMGAKFAPCMRSDKRLIEVLEREKKEENETGCCVKSDNSGCIQTSQAECSKAFAYFYKYSKKNNKTRVVCGQDPESCLDPLSVAPYEWDPNDITKWPICKKVKPNLLPAEYPHLSCDITGRPCCMGNEAKCKIISRDECEFEGGRYYENATLCSQVDCLSSTCGMLDFQNKEKPDQVYRLWMAIFAHAGIIHLACTLVFHFTIMRDLEKMAGWLRLSIIYILSGIGGYLYSAILLPYQAEVGPSGSVFGVIACLFVELFQSWQMIANPFVALFKLCGVVLLLLLIGLLPYVDNFAHMIGFAFGLLLAFIFLPYLSFGKWDRRRKQIQILVCFALVVTLYIVGFLVFYISQETNCSGCEYLNCVPFTSDFCKPYNLGQKLQPR